MSDEFRIFSSIFHNTYFDISTQHYIYRCIKTEDQWIVPYHSLTLMIQYISSRKLAFYLIKYIANQNHSIFLIYKKVIYKFKEHIVTQLAFYENPIKNIYTVSILYFHILRTVYL
jgi:hypothetical protein